MSRPEIKLSMLGRAAQPGKSDERVEAGLNDAWTRSNQRSGPEIEPFGSMPAPSKAHPNSVRDVTRQEWVTSGPIPGLGTTPTMSTGA